jgi:DNA-binding GntR family transcriptional regulator
VAELQAVPGVLRLSAQDDSRVAPLARLVDEQRTTLASHALAALRAAIVDGRLAPGSLSSVAGLAEQFGVSRTPVREALLVLERQGVVRFERNRGVRILETSAHDLEEVFTLRLLLEVPAAHRACDLLHPEDLDALERELDAMASFATAGDEGPFMAHDQRFHEVILLGAGNRRLAAIIGQLRDLVRFRGASTVGRSRDLQEIHAEHVMILAALRDHDAQAAADAMRSHLLTTRRLLLAQEDGFAPEPAWSPSSYRREARKK